MLQTTELKKKILEAKINVVKAGISPVMRAGASPPSSSKACCPN